MSKMGENSSYGKTAWGHSNGHSHILQSPSHINSHNPSIWTPPHRTQLHQVHLRQGDGEGQETSRGGGPASSLLNYNSNTPNENSSPSKSSYTDFFEDREGAGGMRVGRDYQAKVPPLLPKEERAAADVEKALLVWCPSDRLTDDEIEKYLSIARDKFQYTAEQALGLLFWHRYDLQRAIADLGNFTPNPEEWTLEDKVLFEQAFQFHGKAFDRIRQMLPEKSMSSLIRYYYKWKKLKCKTSVMDRQVKKFSQEDGDDQNAPPGQGNNNSQSGNHSNNYQSSSSHHHSNASDSDSDDVTRNNADSASKCDNCGVPSTKLHATAKERMCKTCFLFWKKTGEMRPLTGPIRKGDRQMMGLGSVRQRKSPPKGIYINHDDLQMLASADPQVENVALQGLEKDVHDLKCKVQTSKQMIEMLKAKLPKDGLRSKLPEPSTHNSRINSRWSQEELLMAAQGVRRYGRNFEKIAEVMGTKSEAHLRQFYSNYRRRYDLDTLVKEHQLEVEQLEEMMADNNNESTNSSSETGGTITTRNSSSRRLEFQ